MRGAHAHTFRRNRLASQTEKGKFVDPAEDEIYFGDASYTRRGMRLRNVVNYMRGSEVSHSDLLPINLRSGRASGVCWFD